MTGHTEADHLIHFALSFPAGGALPHSRPLYKLYLWPYTHVKRRTHVLRAHDFRCPIWAPLDPKHIIEHSFGNSLYIRTFELHLFSFFLLCTLSVFDCFTIVVVAKHQEVRLGNNTICAVPSGIHNGLHRLFASHALQRSGKCESSTIYGTINIKVRCLCKRL